MSSSTQAGNAERRIVKARYALLRRHPFFGTLALYLDLAEVERGTLRHDTMATDGRRLYYCREFVDSQSDGELAFLVAHETWHVVLNHLGRRGARNQRKWNYSADLSTNCLLMEEIEADRGRNPSTGAPRMEKPDGALYDERFKGMSAEAIYAKLPDPPGRGCEDEGDGGCEKCEGASKEDAEWWCYGGFDDHLDGEGGVPSFDESSREEWKANVAKAAQAAKARGMLPAGIERLVGELLKPSLPWYDVMRDYIVARVKRYYSYLPPNKRFLQSGLIVPGITGEGLGDVVVGIDTSGSIDDVDLQRFASELQGILDAYEVTLHVFANDAGVHRYHLVNAGEEVPRDYPGGGGTSFIPVFEKVEELGIEPSAMVFLTDTYGAFPERSPRYDVLWVVNHDYEARVPFGRVLRITPSVANSGR